LGLPHVPTSPKIRSCAYTQKVVKLARILKGLGHTVYVYGSEGSDVECDQLFRIGTAEEREVIYGDYDWKKEFFKQDWHDGVHLMANARTVRAINRIKQAGDFLLCPNGNYNKPVADEVKLPLTVESGVGYDGVFSAYRVFESYAWMHHVYGLAKQVDGGWLDTVIPNYYDVSEFHTGPKSDYFLFVGRMVQRKGLHIAIEVTRKLGAKLIVAGQGSLNNVEGWDLSKDASHVSHIGTVGSVERADLMAGAIALFAPTVYIGPFEGVHVEAALCGTPTISTDWGVFTETILQGVTGYRCRVFDDFLEAAKLCPSLDSQVIRDYAVANFSLEAAAVKYQRYFEDLSAGVGKPNWYALHGQPERLNWCARTLPKAA
jgi:glycosyltransferase involved in cell wall biosynthesis